MKYSIIFQVILGADLIYGGTEFESLLKLFRDASDHNTVIYLCSKIRYQRDQNFYNQLLQEQFDVKEIFYETDFAVKIFEIKKLADYYNTLLIEILMQKKISYQKIKNKKKTKRTKEP